MKKIVKDAIQDELKYIDEMNFGESATTNRITHYLGYDFDFNDLMDVEYGVLDEVEKNRDYIMDKSAYDGQKVGLPFNIPFVKMKKH